MFGHWLFVLAVTTQAGSAPPGQSQPLPSRPPAATQPASQPSADTSTGELKLEGYDIGVETIGPDTVILTGPEDALDQLENIIRMMDAETPKRSIEVIKLKNAQAATIAPTLKTAFQALSQPGPGRQPTLEDKIDVQFDPRSNTLLVVVAESRKEYVRKIVEQLDSEPSITQKDFQLIPLKHIRADKAEELLTQFMKQLDSTKQRDKDYVISSDLRQNALWIAAPEKDVAQFRRFIEMIDVSSPEISIAETFIIPLKHAKAADLAKALTDMVTSTEQKNMLKEQISKLKIHKADVEGKEEQEPIVLDLEKPIRVTSDEQTNSLIVAAHPTNIEALKGIVKILDNVAVAEEMFIRIFPLEYADATNLAENLTKFFDTSQSLPEGPGRSKKATEAVPEGPAGKAMVYNVSIHADTRTNTLIVAGRLEQVVLAQTLIDEIDKPGIGSKFPVQIIPLKHADASTIGTVVEQLAKQRQDMFKQQGQSAMERERVFVQPDPRSNSLIVSAKDDNISEIKDLVQKLDLPPEKLIDQIHILSLKNLTATDLGAKIEQLWERRVTQRKERGVPEDRPIVATDSRSNSLVIAANLDDFNAIKQLVDKLEEQQLAPIGEIRLVPIKNNDASALAPVLEKLFQERAKQRLVQGQQELPSDRVSIANDSATNTLLVAASKENFEEIAKLVATLDTEFDTEGAVQIFMLENADASNVASTIENLFKTGVYKPSAGTGSAVSKERDKVAIIPDPRANAIIASASKPNFAIIKMLVDRMDSVDAPKLIGDTALFPLKYADAVKLGDMLDKLFQGIEKGASSKDFRLNMTVIADQATNTLLLAGSRDGLVKARQLIEKMDVESGPAQALFRILPLKHANSIRLAPVIQDLFDQREKGTGTKRVATPFFLQADESSNSLIVSTSAEDLTVLEDLLTKLDVPSAIASQFKIFPLNLAKASVLVETLNDLFAQQRRTTGSRTTGGGRGSGADQVVATNIAADERTNSLLVWASPSDMENIETIIHQLDKADPAQTLTVEVIRLKQALAEDIADLLGSAGIATAEKSSGGRSTRASAEDSKAFILQYFDLNDQGEAVARKLLQQDIRVIPEPRTNSLMMIAPPDSMDMLKSFIANLDEIKPITAEIKVFALQNSDAEEMVKTLDELFKTTESKSSSRKSSTGEPEVQLSLGASAAVASVVGAEGAGRQQLSFTVDARTNSVIAAGTPEYLHLVEQLILELDSKDIEERTRQVYKVKYVDATDLEKTLTSFLEKEVDLFKESKEEVALQQRLQREVTVVADEKSNSVLLNYDPRIQSQISQIIDQLDQPPPQVLVQCLLAEVTLDENVQMGLEFAIQDLLFSETAVVGPNNTIQSNNFDFVGGTDLGAAGTGGGFSFTITGEDFGFLLRALQTDSRLEVLSRPMIMARDNEEAEIKVGKRVPFVSGVSYGDTGRTNSTVQYEDVGIILTVTPHINPDGWVSLEVAPEISDLTDSTVQLTEGLKAPVFLKDTAKTTVYVKDGETVVIGGLIKTKDQDAETKVPVIGDIPLLGNLFKASNVTKSKQELLIVLTPRVVRTERDAYKISVTERDKADLLPERVRQSPLMEKLRVEPGEPGDGLDMEMEEKQNEEQDKDTYGPSPSAYGPTRPEKRNEPQERDALDQVTKTRMQDEVQKVDR